MDSKPEGKSKGKKKGKARQSRDKDSSYGSEMDASPSKYDSMN
jgi:hypothetical protein